MQPQKTTCTFLRNRNRVQRYNKKLKNTNYSVKKHKTYGIILLALLLCGAASAKVNHYVGGFAQVGEWSLIPSKSDYSGSFGVAGGLGFQYELQAGKTYSPARFLLDVGVGATGGLTAYIQSSNRTETLFDQTGLNHQPFDYVYEIKCMPISIRSRILQPRSLRMAWIRLLLVKRVRTICEICLSTSSLPTRK